MSRPLPGDIVSRRKGLVMHRGIALGDGRVLHNTPFKGEHICSESEFRAGKRLYIDRHDAALRKRTLHRAGSVPDSARSYNLFTNNCEHTVSRTMTGRAHSPQLRSWLVGGGMAAATFALTRHPGAAVAAYALGRKLTSRLFGNPGQPH